MHRAGGIVEADLEAKHALLRFLHILKGRDDFNQPDAVGIALEPKAAPAATRGTEDVYTRQLLKDFGEVMGGDVQFLGQFLGQQVMLLGFVGKRDTGANGVFGGLIKKHDGPLSRYSDPVNLHQVCHGGQQACQCARR